ncbi:beta-2-microglobulin-like [Pholidichthys leucotaenia]
MKALTFAVAVVLLCFVDLIKTKEAPPKVQVYTREPGKPEKPNTFICHVSGFHPPEITIELLKNGKEMPDAKQTDLAFEENWFYHMTKHVPFTPTKEDEFACRVTHLGKPRIFHWDPDM